MMSSDFSRNLTKYRKRCSLTQSQLAAQLNVTPQAVSKWENGSLPDPEFLPVLARTLGISLDVLFGLVEEREEPDLTGMIFERLRRTAPEARADVIMELFYAAMAAFKDEPEIRIQYPDHLEKEAYAEIRSNHELAIARLNEDLKYLCFLKIPEGGIDADMGDAAGTTRGLVNLFRTLANEDAITILHYLGARAGTGCSQRSTCRASWAFPSNGCSGSWTDSTGWGSSGACPPASETSPPSSTATGIAPRWSAC